LQFSEPDKDQIKKFLNLRLKTKEIIISDKIVLERKYVFNNSNPGEARRTYTPFLHYKKTQQSKQLSSLEDPLDGEFWIFVKSKLFPEIIFYRDFLSKFPEKIYLQARPDEPKEKEYLSIIEDVLTSINQDYNVETSLLSRLTSPTDANKQALEAVENEMGARISKVVFDAWTKIQKVSKKEIVVKAEQEAGTNRYYIRLNVKEGHQSYAISERSLGLDGFLLFFCIPNLEKRELKLPGKYCFCLMSQLQICIKRPKRVYLEPFKQLQVNHV